ncbi:HEAT repeat domain-containing protein, partial [Bdellovibrionota bacterium]
MKNGRLLRAIYCLIIILSFGLSFYALEEVRAQNDEDDPPPPVPSVGAGNAGVTWVPFSDRRDFLDAPGFIKSLACGPTSLFRIPEDQYFELSRRTAKKEGEEGRLPNFLNLIDTALNTIVGKEDTKLTLFFDSHGLPGRFCTELRGAYDHEKMLRKIFERVEKFQEKHKQEVTIEFHVNACHSFSMRDPLKKVIEDRNGKYTNGEDDNKFKFKVNLLASAPEDKTAENSEYWKTALITSKLKERFDPVAGEECFSVESHGPRLSAFETGNHIEYGCLNTKSLNDHQMWSSYLDLSKLKDTATLVKEAVKMVKEGSKYVDMRAAAAKFLGELGQEVLLVDPTVVQTLIDVITPDSGILADNRNEEFVVAVVWALGNFGSAAKDAVPYLVPLLSEGYVQNTIQALGKIGVPPEVVVPAIISKLYKPYSEKNSIEALLNIGEPAVPYLLDLVRPRRGGRIVGKKSRLLGYEILGKMGGKAKGAVGSLIELVNIYSRRPKLKSSALKALASIDPKSESVVSIFVDELRRENPDPNVAKYLSENVGEPAVDALLSFIKAPGV